MNKIYLCLLFFLLFHFCTEPVNTEEKQDGDYFTISGTLYFNNDPYAGINIFLKRSDNVVFQTSINKNGDFLFAIAEQDSYELKVYSHFENGRETEFKRDIYLDSDLSLGNIILISPSLLTPSEVTTNTIKVCWSKNCGIVHSQNISYFAMRVLILIYVMGIYCAILNWPKIHHLLIIFIKHFSFRRFGYFEDIHICTGSLLEIFMTI